MNWKERNRNRVENLTNAAIRFWLATAAFVLAALFFMYDIEFGVDHYERITTLLIVGFSGIAVQLLIERFFREKKLYQITLYVAAVLFASGYYIYLVHYDGMFWITAIRTWVIIFSLFIASIWFPTVKKENVTYSTSFLIFFKVFFTSLLFSIVLTIGLMAIIGAFHFLILDVDMNIYIHVLTLIWLVFFPLYFLSLIPEYPNGEESDSYQQAKTVPKFLEILLSYIVVPVIVAYTAILLLYILTNITGDFWSDNLLEPLLVSYAITGWIALFLIESIITQSGRLFKQYFPKLLLVVVSFQTIATVMKINSMGITHGRYFVLLFSIFSTLSCLLYIFFYEKRNAIPGILILLSIVSILPYVDAVSLGIRSQTNRLEETLIRNQMLEDHSVQPDDSIPENDKERIVESVQYLDRMDHLDELDYLVLDEYNYFSNQAFIETFGFDQYTLDAEESDPYEPTTEPDSFHLRLEDSDARQMDVADSDLVVPLYVSNGSLYPSFTDEEFYDEGLPVTFNEMTYYLYWAEEEQDLAFIVETDNGESLIEMDLSDLLERSEPTSGYEFRDLETMTSTESNEQISVRLVFTELEVMEDQLVNGEMYTFIRFE